MARKKPLPPRRHRMKRAARLAAAPHWLPTYRGERVISAYARWFHVDLQCALIELRMLGVPLDPAYVSHVETTIRERARKPPARRVDSPEHDGYGVEWDDNFAYIAGFTAGGFPFGTTWAEVEQAQAREREPGEDDGPVNDLAAGYSPNAEGPDEWLCAQEEEDDNVPF